MRTDARWPGETTPISEMKSVLPDKTQTADAWEDMTPMPETTSVVLGDAGCVTKPKGQTRRFLGSTR